MMPEVAGLVHSVLVPCSVPNHHSSPFLSHIFENVNSFSGLVEVRNNSAASLYGPSICGSGCCWESMLEMKFTLKRCWVASVVHIYESKTSLQIQVQRWEDEPCTRRVPRDAMASFAMAGLMCQYTSSSTPTPRSMFRNYGCRGTILQNIFNLNPWA